LPTITGSDLPQTKTTIYTPATADSLLCQQANSEFNLKFEMASDLLIPFSSTPVESIAPTVSRLQSTFTSLKTHPLAYREEQLRKLYWGIKDNEQQLLQALKADLGKPYFEAMIAELYWICDEILYVLKNLRKWAADDKVDLPLLQRLIWSPRFRKEPMGTVLVIGYVLARAVS